MAGSTPGGYIVHHGLFRMPDLLTYEQMQTYFRDVYGYHVELYPFDEDGNPDYDHEGSRVASARALGQSFNIAPGAQLDGRARGEDEDLDVLNAKSLFSGVDPVLREINETVRPAAYNTDPIGNVPAEDDDRVERVQVVDKSEEVDEYELRDTADLGDLSSDEDEPTDDYEDRTNEQLRSELIDRGLPSSGNKTEMVERLRENDRAGD